jgi:hypothetical protein
MVRPLFNFNSIGCIALRARSAYVCLLACAVSLAFTPTLSAARTALGPYAASIEKLEPFDVSGLESGVAHVLHNYYQHNFTPNKEWAAVQSFRFDGSLHLPQGSLRFTAFKKKPDLCKIVLYAPGDHQIVMAYDGHHAWQLNTRQSAQPEDMPSAEARNFIRDATTGGHLLYPGIKGKTMELLGTTQIGGDRTYEIRITLPDGLVIRSFLDMVSFAEVQQITINQVSGQEEVTRYGDFRMIKNTRVPFTSTLFINGEQIHQSRIDAVRVNQGVTPWMFRRPGSAADLTDDPTASPASDPDESLETDRLMPEAPTSFFDIDLDSEIE